MKEKGTGKSTKEKGPQEPKPFSAKPTPFAADKFLSNQFANYCRVPKPKEPEVMGLDIYPGAWTETEDASGQMTNGDHVIFAPAYDSTSEDIKEMLELFKEGIRSFDWLKYV